MVRKSFEGLFFLAAAVVSPREYDGHMDLLLFFFFWFILLPLSDRLRCIYEAGVEFMRQIPKQAHSLAKFMLIIHIHTLEKPFLGSLEGFHFFFYSCRINQAFTAVLTSFSLSVMIAVVPKVEGFFEGWVQVAALIG